MAPRRGGEAGAGAQVALAGGRGAFEPPPLKRMQPWQQDGAGQCDIMAGGVDDSGTFKGIYLSSVNLLALLRTFQLAKPFMPVETNTPLAQLGQSLYDGIPLVVVTRGCYGRDMDAAPGPVRNETQKAVWETVRQMRADMPQVLITCIDLPINCTSEVLQGVLEPPLNQYRELMYHEGTWYTPSLIPAASLAFWRAERKREKQVKSGAGVSFNRKKFAWIDEAAFYKDMYTLGWKEVLQVRPPPSVPRRTDLNFVDRERQEVKPIQDAGPSAALATFRKVIEQARGKGEAKSMDVAIKAYLDRAKWYEKDGLTEAISACQEVAGLYRSESKFMDACTTVGMAVGAYIYMNEVDKALQMATELRTSAVDARVEVKATRMVLDCLFATGNMDKALEAARDAKASVAKKGDAEALADASGLVVMSLVSKGDLEEAITVATEATNAGDKAAQAKGWVSVAEAQVAKAGQAGGDSVTQASSLDEAAKAQQTAKRLFNELGRRKEEGEALQAAVGMLIGKDEFTQALELAKELQAFSEDEQTLALGASGAQLVAAAHLRNHAKNGSFIGDGGEQAMLAAAKQAVASFERLNDTARRGEAQQTLREAIRVATANM